MITKTFITAGKAIFTLELASDFASQHSLPAHYTFKVNKKENTWFVSLLTGPDNYANYSYLGLLRPENGQVILTRKSRYNAETWVVKLLQRTLQRVWAGEQVALENAGFRLHHEGKCGRCGRRLTVPESIETGLGPECAGKV